jgi:hypothetical protein
MYLHIVQKIRTSGAIPLLSLNTFISWTGKTLPLHMKCFVTEVQDYRNGSIRYQGHTGKGLARNLVSFRQLSCSCMGYGNSYRVPVGSMSVKWSGYGLNCQGTLFDFLQERGFYSPKHTNRRWSSQSLVFRKYHQLFHRTHSDTV